MRSYAVNDTRIGAEGEHSLMVNFVSRLALVLAVAEASAPDSTTSGSAQTSIGDDACALMLRIEATVVRADGKAISGAEVWMMDRRMLPPNTRASRIGVTDAEGRLTAPACYMPTLEFRFWRPTEDPVRFQFFVMAAGFGVERVELSPPIEEVLASGSLLATKPGEYTPDPRFRPDSRQRAYAVKLPFSLHPTLR